MRRLFRFLLPVAPLLFLTAAFAQPAPTAAPPPSTAAPAGTTAAPTSALPSFPVEEMRLRNGLQVLLAPDASLPNVAVRVQYHVGSADEPEGLDGIAHLVEHLTFERSAHVPRGALLHLLANAGATDLNGETALDSTYYHEAVPTERLELALWLESDRMGYFLDAVDSAALEQERGVVLTEMRTRIKDTPGGILPVATFDAAFPSWHPYHESVDSEEADTKRITLADVKAFYATWYGPENATLVLAGRFDPAQARALVERYFGSLPGHPPPRRPPLPKLERKGPTRIEVGAAVGEEAIQVAWVTPAWGTPGDAELDWVAAILGRGSSSRLQKRLVEDGLAVSFSARQSSKQQASLFTIRATVAKGHKADEVLLAIDRELGQLATLGPSAVEMARAASYWEVAEAFSLESAMGRASIVGLRASHGPVTVPFDWRIHQGAVFTAAALQGAAAKYLAPSARAAEVIVRPKKGTPLSGIIVSREEP